MTHLSYYVGYKQTSRDYKKDFAMSFSDFTHLIPNKRLEKKQPTHMGGAYGFTYSPPALDYMCLDNTLTGKFKDEVDVHESIHTPDEYETRVLSRWMIEEKGNKYQFRHYNNSSETRN
jgi:hypothetical protein